MLVALGLTVAAGAVTTLAGEATTCVDQGKEHVLLLDRRYLSSSERARSGGDAARSGEENSLLRTASSGMDSGKDPGDSFFFCPPRSHQSQAYAVPLASPDAFEPVLASHPPGSEAAEQVIIVIHGAARASEQSFRETVRIVGSHNKQERTLVVAPSWGEKTCWAPDWLSGKSNHQLRNDSQAPYWSVKRPFLTTEARAWMFGGGSDRGAHSFEILDSVVEWIEVNYPRLRRVVVTGFSAGGQYVQRWAALSPEGANGVTRSRGLPLRIIVSGPSTFVYLSEERPDPACLPDEDEGPHWKCRNFSIPSPGRDCDSRWDKYWIGLDGLQDGASSEGQLRHDVNQYLRNFVDTSSSSLLSKEIRNRWATKDIRFLFGSRDTKHCDVGSCSNLCEAMLTGKNRLQRGLNLMGYLARLFPGSQPVWGIFDGGHNFLLAYASRHWTAWALQDHGADVEDWPVVEVDALHLQAGHAPTSIPQATEARPRLKAR